MDTERLARALIDQSDPAARARLLARHAHLLDDHLAQTLKNLADHYLRTEVERAKIGADALLQLAEFSGDPRHRALGLLAWGNIHSLALGDYEAALPFFDEAAAIYREVNDRVNLARSQIGKIWALLNLSRYEEVEATAAWASQILEEEGEWLLLAKLSMNRAVSRGRQGDDLGALAMFDRTRALLESLGDAGRPYIPWVDQNRSIVLRNLGRLQESLAAAEQAWRGMEAHGELVEAARARQSMAVTYLLLGRYTEALTLMEEARRIFIEDGRQRDALLLDVFLADGLLSLRRFQDVLDITRNARTFFAQRGMQQEIGQALLDEAVAYAGLGRFDEARASLDEARRHFMAEANPALLAKADLQLAALWLHLGELDASADLLAHAEQVFRQGRQRPQLAQTWLLQARIALARQAWDEAETLVRRALDAAQEEEIMTLAFRARHILGQILAHRGQARQAMREYARAIRHLERLHGHLMTEFQADFLEDKTDVYEDAALLALEMGEDARALEMAERAKSRSLLNMLTHRIDLSLHARRVEDEAIVEELMRLRRERNRILTRWQTGEDARAGKAVQEIQHRLWELERQITQRWHQLLLHNADYARDAALWQVRAEPPQPWLDEGVLLVEYVIARGQIIAFLVDRTRVEGVRLAAAPAQVTKLLNMLALNNRTLPWAPPQRQRQLARNARGILAKLHDALLAPIKPRLDRYSRLVITPHAALHYLPFHALFDGQRYLIETHEISYLPASSLLRFIARARHDDGRVTAFGYSGHGMLPQAPEEARRVAEIMGGEAWIEEEATVERVKQEALTARVVHIAAHGVFRADNPLFAGVLLADGWLTALDIFSLHFEASLITLSACDTGQHRIGGGDELLGLTRSFLYAGAASLLLSHWQIPDAIAFTFIDDFYRRLAAGKRKAQALREAQLALMRRGQEGDPATTHYQHPFIWAPFFLIGAADALNEER